MVFCRGFRCPLIQVGRFIEISAIKREYYVNDIKGNLYTPAAINGLMVVKSLPSSEMLSTTPEKKRSISACYSFDFRQVTIKTTPPVTMFGSAVRIYLDETAALPAKNKEISGFEADIVILLLFTMLINRKPLPACDSFLPIGV